MARKPLLLSTSLLVAGLVPAASAQVQEILIDFGRINALSNTDPLSGDVYNNIASPGSTGYSAANPFPAIADLANTAGSSTGYGFDLTAVNNLPPAGTNLGIGGFNATGNAGLAYVGSAGGDTMFVLNDTEALFRLGDLDGSKTYDLTMYNFIGNQGRNDSLWTVGGSTLALNPQNNTAGTVTFSGISPDGSNGIDILFEVDDTGTSAQQGHWNVLEVNEVGGGPRVLIDFGQNGSLSNTDALAGDAWNNAAAAGGPDFGSIANFPTITDAVASDGAATAIDFDLVSVANPPVADPIGGKVGIGGADFPADASATGFDQTATRDTMFVLTEGNDISAEFTLSGLKTDGTTYDLDMFGALPADRADTLFTVNGQTKSYDPENNTSSVASFEDLLPDANGDIVITFEADFVAGGSFAQGHWNALRVTEVPEPGSVALLVAGTLAGLRRRR